MLRYTIKRLLYGILVLLGVVTLVFFLFNILPGDPARMMLGQRADEESIRIINRDLGRDKPIALQYLNYLNDLLPISVHNNENVDDYFYLDSEKYAPYTTLLKVGSTSVVAKAPYLRRSYQSKRKVSEIISSAFPQTALLAVVSLTFALILGYVFELVKIKTRRINAVFLFLGSITLEIYLIHERILQLTDYWFNLLSFDKTIISLASNATAMLLSVVLAFCLHSFIFKAMKLLRNHTIKKK